MLGRTTVHCCLRVVEKQMGTSVEMLEKFYGQTVSSALAAQKSKGNQTVGAGNGKVYPFG